VYLIRLAVAITQRLDALEGEIAEQEARVERRSRRCATPRSTASGPAI